MAWGNDPLVSVDAPKPSTSAPAKLSGGGWGKGPLVDATAEDGTLTPAEQMAKATAPKGGDLARFEGLTFGFGDEAIAGLSAGLTGIGNLADRAVGKAPKYGAGEAYDATLEQTRKNMANYANNSPVGSFTNELFGGAISGGPASSALIKGGETLFKRLGLSALTGAGFGVVAGAGSGEGGFVNRAKSSGEGAIVGAGVGIVPGAIAESIPAGKRTASYAGKALREVFQKFSGKTPEDAAKTMRPEDLKKYSDMALDYVKKLIEDSGSKIENLTEDPAFKQGKPVTGAEAIGRQGANQLASIGRRAGTTGDVAESQFRLRGNERADRLQENLAKAASVDPRHTQGHVEQLVEDLQAKNDPQYAKAFAQPSREVEGDRDFQAIAQQPNFQAGLKIAQEAAANKQEHIGLFQDEEGKWYGSPSWKHLDMIKKAMDSVVTRKHTNGVGKFTRDFQSNADVEGVGNFRDWLFNGNKEYQTAVSKAGDTITLRKAYEDAANLMSNKTTEHQYDKAVNNMTPAQLEAHKSGWVNDVFNKLQSGRLKPKDLQTPEFIAKSRRLLGETQSRQFMDAVEQELRLKAGEQRIPPGRQSITGELKHAGEEMDREADEMLHGFISNLKRRGLSTAVVLSANDLLAKILSEARTPAEKALHDEVGKLLLMKPDQLKAKLEAKTGISPKGKEIGRMILHLMTGPTAATATQEVTQ